MTVALAGRAPATFEIKSATLPLVALLLKSADLAALAEELNAHFGDIPDFFDNDPLVVDLSRVSGQEHLDFRELLHLLRGYRVFPVAVRGGNATQMSAALEAGLAAANDAEPLGRAAPDMSKAERELAQFERDLAQFGQLAPSGSAPAQQTPASAPQAAPRAEPPPEVARHALIVDKPLRSGQQVYARGRDLVVLSMVNPGAEVIADGSIHVYAPLRGRAIAGAKGNTDARIFSMCLEPQLISIAGIYRTSEVPLPAEVLSKPTQVRLVGGSEGKLVMEPIKA